MRDKSQKEGGRRGAGPKKRWLFFKGLRKESRRWKFLWSAFKWRNLTVPVFLMEDLIFKVVFVFEAIFLVLRLCFFYILFGCSI